MIVAVQGVLDERITVAPFGQSRFAVPTEADDLLCSGGFTLLDVFLFGRNFQVLVLDVEAEAVVNAHVLVGYPYEGEEGDEISTPSRIEHVETRNDQEQGRDVVAETIFAGEEIKKFAPGEAAGLTRLTLTIFSWLAEYFFVSDGPCNAGHRNSQHKKPRQLHSEGDGEAGDGCLVGCVAGARET